MSCNVILENKSLDDLIDIVYPVGSVYISVTSTNPQVLFGGEWTQIKDTFLLACGNNYANGATGGEANHTLTVNEMPSHSHQLQSISGYDDLNFINGDGKFHIQNSDTTVGWGSAKDATYYYGTTHGTTGGSQPHNNMPPYLAVYMWKRTS